MTNDEKYNRTAETARHGSVTLPSRSWLLGWSRQSYPEMFPAHRLEG